jgi:hypothetical protein
MRKTLILVTTFLGISTLYAADPAGYKVTILPLSGASAAGISMDYFGYAPVVAAPVK